MNKDEIRRHYKLTNEQIDTMFNEMREAIEKHRITQKRKLREARDNIAKATKSAKHRSINASSVFDDIKSRVNKESPFRFPGSGLSIENTPDPLIKKYKGLKKTTSVDERNKALREIFEELGSEAFAQEEAMKRQPELKKRQPEFIYEEGMTIIKDTLKELNESFKLSLKKLVLLTKKTGQAIYDWFHK